MLGSTAAFFVVPLQQGGTRRRRSVPRARWRPIVKTGALQQRRRLRLGTLRPPSVATSMIMSRILPGRASPGTTWSRMTRVVVLRVSAAAAVAQSCSSPFVVPVVKDLRQQVDVEAGRDFREEVAGDACTPTPDSPSAAYDAYCSADRLGLVEHGLLGVVAARRGRSFCIDGGVSAATLITVAALSSLVEDLLRERTLVAAIAVETLPRSGFAACSRSMRRRACRSNAGRPVRTPRRALEMCRYVTSPSQRM